MYNKQSFQPHQELFAIFVSIFDQNISTFQYFCKRSSSFLMELLKENFGWLSGLVSKYQDADGLVALNQAQ
jgi:hypothetical protein